MSKEEVSDDDQQLVPKDETKASLDENGSVTTSQQAQLIDVTIPLDDRFNCHVQLTRCPIDSSIDNASKMDKQEDIGEFEEPTASWEEYLDLFSAAYPCSQQEVEEFFIAVYDENDFDPAIFLNANMDWIPR